LLFDDVDSYYQPEDGRYWQQGDIVLAPSAVFDADHTHLDEVPLEPPKPGAPIRRLLWPGTTSKDTRAVVCEAQVCPAVITTHDCTLDKEFNRRVSQLRQAHVPLKEATRQAAQDNSLDRYLTVAPIVPFADAAPSDPHQLARNTVVGYFPICASTDRRIDAGVADILRATTIDRTLIVDRFAILGDAVVAALRYALARFWVYLTTRSAR